jgi:peroxiredoxin
VEPLSNLIPGIESIKHRQTYRMVRTLMACVLCGVLLSSCHQMVPLAPAAVQFAPTLAAPLQPKLPGVGTSVGDIAPDFQLPGINGQMARLSDYRGKPVLLNFWTYCAACKEEMPIIQSVYSNIEITAPGSIILGVNVTQESDQVQQFVQHYGLTFDILLDRWGTVASEYYIRQIPTTYFIDKNGIIQDIQAGQFSGPAVIQKKLAELASH